MSQQQNQEIEEQHDDLTHDQIEELKNAFDVFDKDGNGFITSKELGSVMRSLGQNPTDAELHTMINQADLDGNGIVNFPEFVAMMLKRLEGNDKNEGIREAFRAFDVEDKGFICANELRHVLSSLHVQLSPQEVNEIVQEADITGTGKITFEEFAFMFDK
ncbi:neo-calmodulin-like [Asterias amurensis]|uniref:neo-calmodulin-like n=1 Tax=Asterias amurensis TaxID=7602 RepID=UPI003AB509A1